MRIASLCFFGIATALLAMGGAVYGLFELTLASLVLGGMAVFAFAFGRPILVHALFGLYGVTTALFGLFRVPPLLCAAALAAALVGWDAALVAPRIADAPPEARGRFALRYALRSTGLAVAGVLLVLAAGTIHVALTFGSGLALSLAVLVVAALFLRILRRTGAHENDEPPESQ